MNPIPLSAPDGRVFAYVCGICSHVAGGSSVLYTSEEFGPIDILVESSLRSATWCCACRICGILVGRGVRGWGSRSECIPCDWWNGFKHIWWKIGSGYNGETCPICHGAYNNYCRDTPACIDCNDDHGGSPGGRCRDCDLENLGRQIGEDNE